VSQRWLYVELTGLQREQAGTRDCNEPERFENVETEGGGIFENGSHHVAPLGIPGALRNGAAPIERMVSY
jgi:hypothetical protein